MNISSSGGSEPLIKENVMQTTEFKWPFEDVTKTAYPKVCAHICDVVVSQQMKIITNFAQLLLQEYKEAMTKLRKAYFSNVTNVDAIKRANNDLLSDSTTTHQIIEAVVLQANANQKATNKVESKNTFLFR